MEHERDAFGRAQRLEHDDQREPDRVAEQRRLLRVALGADHRIRNARVEVLDAVTRTLLSVSETGDHGQFLADVPADAPACANSTVVRRRSFSPG